MSYPEGQKDEFGPLFIFKSATAWAYNAVENYSDMATCSIT
jgi:hypothetical protein